MFSFKSKKEKFLNALEQDDIKKANKYVFEKEIDIFNNFSLYLSEAENSNNIKFITNFLQLFMENNLLILTYNSLEDFNDYLTAWQNEKKYDIVQEILKKNYTYMIRESEFLLNKGILYYFATNDDIKGFEIAIKYIENKEELIDILDFLLKYNHNILTYIYKKHEYLIKSALNKYPEIKNNEVFKTYINQNKINNF
tara:strand:- start:1827 stop:2417 length:591 start_codon:yes stop_codon:yes gene_type:complete